MSRVAVVADSHFDETSRFDECVRLHDWIADDMRKRDVQVVLHSGDVFERRSTAKERAAFAAWLEKVTRFADVLIVRGNHDQVGDLPLFAKLKSGKKDFGIAVEEGADMHMVGGVAVGALAWPRRAEMLARAPDLDPADALRAVLRGLGERLRAASSHSGPDGCPRILLAHAMVRGSVTSTGQPLVGGDMEIGLEDLALAGADFVALGHVHKSQSWAHGGVPIFYPGSPRRTAFGELEDKGYAFLEFKGKWLLNWEHVVIPATPMVLIEASWREGSFDITSKAFPHAKRVGGAEVRFRYDVPADERDAAKRVALERRDKMLAEGAVLVKVEEEVIATTRARAPEIATAKTLPEKLRLLWEVRGIEMGKEREERVLGRLAEVEAA